MDALTALEEHNRDALELARCAAIASRIEPALLRALRFELLPHADVAAEADLWWSDLVDLRAADAVRLSARALEALHAWLAERPQRVRDAYRIVRRVHRDASPFARLQEWLSYRALITPRHPIVAGTLAAVVGTIVRDEPRRDEAAAWALVALPRLPSVLRELPAFWSLAFAANRHGRGAVVLDGTHAAAALFEAARQAFDLGLAAGPVELELGHDGDHLVLRRSDRPPRPGGLIVPDLSPLVIAVTSGDDTEVVIVDARAGTPLRAASLPITIEAIDGSLYELRARPVRSRVDFGLVIGIDHYQSLPPLRGAVRDANAFRDWLLDRNGGGLSTDNTWMILSAAEPETPTQDSIDHTLVQIVERARTVEGARRLYLYFSGYGARSEGARSVTLLLSRWSPSLARLALSLDHFVSALAATGVFEEIVVFVDSQIDHAAPVIGLGPTFTMPSAARTPTRTFIAFTAESGRLAYETRDSSPSHGILTRCLLSILRAPGVSAHDLKRRLTAELPRLRPSLRAEVMNGLRDDSYFGRRGARFAETRRLRCGLVSKDERLHAMLAQSLTRSPLLELVDPEDAEVRLEQVDGRWFVTDDVHGTEPDSVLLALTERQLDHARVVLEHYYRYAWPLRMAEAAEDAYALQISVLACPSIDLAPEQAQAADLDEIQPAAHSLGGPIHDLAVGARVCFRVTNISERPLRVALVNSAASGKVQILGEDVIDGRSQFIFWARGNLGKPFIMSLPPGATHAIDRLTALGTTQMTANLDHLRLDRTIADTVADRGGGVARDIDAGLDEITPGNEPWAADRAIVRTRAI